MSFTEIKKNISIPAIYSYQYLWESNFLKIQHRYKTLFLSKRCRKTISTELITCKGCGICRKGFQWETEVFSAFITDLGSYYTGSAHVFVSCWSENNFSFGASRSTLWLRVVLKRIRILSNEKSTIRFILYFDVAVYFATEKRWVRGHLLLLLG